MCKCINETDDKLRERGYKLSDTCIGFRVTEELSLSVDYGLPIVRTDGKRRKRSDPSIIVISHCPFCGELLKPAKEKKGEPANHAKGR